MQLTKLQKCNVSSCELSSFPVVLCELITLQKLDISNNYLITSIPAAILKLIKLKILNITGCGPTKYPDILPLTETLEDVHNNRNSRDDTA